MQSNEKKSGHRFDRRENSISEPTIRCQSPTAPHTLEPDVHATSLGTTSGWPPENVPPNLARSTLAFEPFSSILISASSLRWHSLPPDPSRAHTHTHPSTSFVSVPRFHHKKREMARSFSIKQAPQQTKRSPEAASREPGSYSSSRRTRGPRQVVAIAAGSAPSAATDRWQAGPVDIGNYSISPSWWGPSRRSFSVL